VQDPIERPIFGKERGAAFNEPEDTAFPLKDPLFPTCPMLRPGGTEARLECFWLAHIGVENRRSYCQMALQATLVPGVRDQAFSPSRQALGTSLRQSIPKWAFRTVDLGHLKRFKWRKMKDL
jgi:hypothetical protein